MYAAGINESSLSNLNLIAILKHPDLKNQLSIHYQPKINLKDGVACGLKPWYAGITPCSAAFRRTSLSRLRSASAL
jgi:hypothetical protein